MSDKRKLAGLKISRYKDLSELKNKHVTRVESVETVDEFPYPFTKEELLKQLIINEAARRQTKRNTALSWIADGPNTPDDDKSFWAIEKLHMLVKNDALIHGLFSDEEEVPSIFDSIIASIKSGKLDYKIDTASKHRNAWAKGGRERVDYGILPESFVTFVESALEDEMNKYGKYCSKLGTLAARFHTEYGYLKGFPTDLETVKSWALKAHEKDELNIDEWVLSPGPPRSRRQ